MTRASTPQAAGRPPVALTIAGTDSGGGAGVFADLKTFAAHGVWGTAAVTAVTAQNTLGVQAVETLAPSMVVSQIASVATDIGVDAAKTGMLSHPDLVAAVAAAIRAHGIDLLVVDPVAVSKHGDVLLDDAAVEVVRRVLLPLAVLVTPNIPEAAVLTGVAITDRAGMEQAGRQLLDLGARAALVKGGHLSDSGSADAPDCLIRPGAAPVWLEGERTAGRHTHGTGCVLSAAITARLARGDELEDACRGAKAFVADAIRAGLDLGGGVGPVNPRG